MQKISVISFILQETTLKDLKDLYATAVGVIDEVLKPSEKFRLLHKKINDAIDAGQVSYSTLNGRTHVTVSALCDLIVKSLAEYCYRNC